MNTASIVDATELEHETGLGKDLLRKWRARYGFPTPLHSADGEYGYPKEQIAQLRLIRRLQNAGFRPNHIVGKSLADLERLVEAAACGGEAQELPVTREVLNFLKQFDLDAIDRLLVWERHRQSLQEFIAQTVAPLVTAIGEAWARGEIEVYHEHLCTNVLLRRLLAEIGAAQPVPGYPRIVFATPSEETHLLGLLMAQAVLAEQGAECIDVGANIPLHDLEMAVGGAQADILALSFSFAYPKWRVRPILKHLRERLPATVEIWAGGAGLASIKRPPQGVRIFSDLHDASAALAAWAKAASAAVSTNKAGL